MISFFLFLCVKPEVKFCQIGFFYSGCVIMEVRDFRRTNVNALHPVTYYDRSFVILKPTDQNLIEDVINITLQKQIKSLLDSSGHSGIRISTHSCEQHHPLNLYPRLSSTYLDQRIQFKKKMFHQPEFRA